MRAWPVARSIFDAPLCERSERADNKLDKVRSGVWGRLGAFLDGHRGLDVVPSARSPSPKIVQPVVRSFASP